MTQFTAKPASTTNRIFSQAIVVAVGVAADGRREILGLDGVRLVVSDAHGRLEESDRDRAPGCVLAAIPGPFHGQRPFVVPKDSQDVVASIIRTVFVGPDREHIEKQFTEVATMVARSHPKVAAILDEARPETSSPSPVSRNETSDRSDQRTHWNGSIKRLNAEPTSSACSPPPPRSCGSLAQSWSSSTTNEKPATTATTYESSMLELKTMNDSTDPIEKVTLLELIAAWASNTDLDR